MARKLRNVFAHGSGRCNPANSDHQKLRNEIIERFGLNPDECPEGWFPLPIEKVLSKLTQGCVDYVVALVATRHAGRWADEIRPPIFCGTPVETAPALVV